MLGYEVTQLWWRTFTLCPFYEVLPHIWSLVFHFPRYRVSNYQSLLSHISLLLVLYIILLGCLLYSMVPIGDGLFYLLGNVHSQSLFYPPLPHTQICLQLRQVRFFICVLLPRLGVICVLFTSQPSLSYCLDTKNSVFGHLLISPESFVILEIVASKSCFSPPPGMPGFVTTLTTHVL